MGQNQLFIIALVAAICGISAFGGLRMMQTYEQDQERDAVVHQMKILIVEARKHAARTITMGGGAGTFTNFQPPARLATTIQVSIQTSAVGSIITFVGEGTILGDDLETPVRVIGVFDNDNKTFSRTIVN